MGQNQLMCDKDGLSVFLSEGFWRYSVVHDESVGIIMVDVGGSEGQDGVFRDISMLFWI